MESRFNDRSAARHELALAGVLLVGIARLVDPPGGWLVASLALATMLLAGIAVMGDETHGVPVASLLVPAVLVAGACGAIALVPLGLGLIPAILLLAFVLDRTVRLELRLVHQPAGVSPSDRSRVLLGVVVAGFVAFTGVATLVPGGLAEPIAGALSGGRDAGGSGAGGLPEGWLVGLAAAHGLVALLLGYRASALRYGTVHQAAWSALTYGVVVAIAAGAARAIDLPRLVGPAVLALVFYLWDAVHGSAPARRREARFIWELGLLLALGVGIVAWNLQLRG